MPPIVRKAEIEKNANTTTTKIVTAKSIDKMLPKTEDINQNHRSQTGKSRSQARQTQRSIFLFQSLNRFEMNENY